MKTCLDESLAAEKAGLEIELLDRRSRESARDVESASLMESLATLMESGTASESGNCGFTESRTFPTASLLDCRRSLRGFCPNRDMAEKAAIRITSNIVYVCFLICNFIYKFAINKYTT